MGPNVTIVFFRPFFFYVDRGYLRSDLYKTHLMVDVGSLTRLFSGFAVLYIKRF